MLLGGGALTVYALTRRRPGIALAAAGGLLAYRGATLGTTKFRARVSFAINCEPETAYRMWRGLEDLPIFMRHLESVRGRGDGRSEWTAIGPMGKRLRWNAEITEDRYNEFLAWRSTQDSDFQNWGSVEFRRAPGNRGTIVTAEMEYAPPGGALGNFVITTILAAGCAALSWHFVEKPALRAKPVRVPGSIALGTMTQAGI